MNSFKHVEAAIEYEIARQSDLVSRGERVVQETRLVERRQGHVARDALQRAGARLSLLPRARSAAARRRRRVGRAACAASCPSCRLRAGSASQSLGLSAYDAGVLTAERDLADYFDAVVAAGAAAQRRRQLGHRELRAYRDAPAPASTSLELIQLIKRRHHLRKIAKDVFDAMLARSSPRAIVEARGPGAAHRRRRHRSGVPGGRGCQSQAGRAI